MLCSIWGSLNTEVDLREVATAAWGVQEEVEDLRWVQEVDLVTQDVLRCEIYAIASTTSSVDEYVLADWCVRGEGERVMLPDGRYLPSWTRGRTC